MTGPEWNQVEDLFEACSELPPEERARYLGAHCPDPEVRAEVESLLRYAAPEGAGVGSVIGGLADMLPGTDTWTGRRVGPYLIQELIGSGGMGSVYRAVRDDEYRQQVAIKVVKVGMDSSGVLQRFRQERQILANLEHPNIARLLDGGTTESGEPYLVMEFVDGERLTDYCKSRSLDSIGRVRMLVPICEAVSYAHRQLIVHRDLKPGNILVTRNGSPKLLDFGIAKLLDDGAERDLDSTRTGMHLLTPNYASPEQVRGEPASTSSDVYSLGAVLYEVLTEAKPHQFANSSPSEVAKVICEMEVVRPSLVRPDLHRSLSGDLDSIVMKAMRKEPERRYESVAQLAEDLQRFLDGLPVGARPESWAYTAGKFIRRNWVLSSALLVLALSLVAGAVGILYEADRAERRFQQVRHLANRFLFDFHDQIAALPGSLKAREMVAKTALEYLDSLSAEAGRDTSLQLELAQAYEKVAEVQGYPSRPNLGQPEAAVVSFKKSVALHNAVLSRDPGNSQVQRSLCKTLFSLGHLQSVQRDLQGAKESVGKSLEMAQKFFHEPPSEKLDYQLIGSAHISLGDIAIASGDLREAAAQYGNSLMYRQRAYERDPSAANRRQLSVIQLRVGRTQIGLGDLVSAERNFLSAIRLREQNVQADTAKFRALRDLAVVKGDYSLLLSSPHAPNLGRQAEALQHATEVYRLIVNVSASDMNSALTRDDLAYNDLMLAMHLLPSNPIESEKYCREALAIVAKADSEKLAAPSAESYRAGGAACLANALGRQGKFAEGRKMMAQSLSASAKLASAHTADDEQEYASRLLDSAELETRAGDKLAAITVLKQAVSTIAEMRRRHSSSANFALLHSQALGKLAALGDNSREWSADNRKLWEEWNATRGTAWSREQAAVLVQPVSSK